MRKYLSLGFTLLCLYLANAQHCAYSTYYSHITSGREAYSKKNYKEAAKSFQAALAEPVFPSGIDLQTALEIADEINDQQWAETIAIKLAKGGIPLRFFHRYSKRKWYDTFSKNFNDYEKFYALNFNIEAKKGLLEVRDLDKSFNEKFHLWREGVIELQLQELIDGATAVTEALEALCKEHGVPTDQSLGYYYYKNRIEEYPVGVILIHTYQRGKLLFYNQLEQLVCEGVLTPQLQQTLATIRGFGDSTGIDQEMKARYKKFRTKT